MGLTSQEVLKFNDSRLQGGDLTRKDCRGQERNDSKTVSHQAWIIRRVGLLSSCQTTAVGWPSWCVSGASRLEHLKPCWCSPAETVTCDTSQVQRSCIDFGIGVVSCAKLRLKLGGKGTFQPEQLLQ